MRRSSFFLVLTVVLWSGSIFNLQAQCGVERWPIKIGTDSQAPSISLSTYVSTTIYNMLSSARPASIPATTRLSPRETTQYSVSGTLIQYKRETDSDYHLVIKDSSGRTMIIEIPSPNCVGSGSPFGTRISSARAQFDSKLTATSTMKNVVAPVTVHGIGFWDFLHGQTGVAPNGIEVHPVLSISFTGSITAADSKTIVSESTPLTVSLPSDMVEDNDGGRVHVYRAGDAVDEVYFHGGGVIEQPRIRIVFAGNFNDATKRAILDEARHIDSDPRFATLARYGVGTRGISIDSELAVDGRNLRVHGSQSFAGSTSDAAFDDGATDLDVQRLLANAIEAGRIQHLDENVLTVVVVDPDTTLAVGTTRDWRSYHSLFHPTELAMPYVVVRGAADQGALREAMYASVARALIDPAGDGWY
jgi:hypothetical protein